MLRQNLKSIMTTLTDSVNENVTSHVKKVSHEQKCYKLNICYPRLMKTDLRDRFEFKRIVIKVLFFLTPSAPVSCRATYDTK